jgi:selenium-dependent molybdenum hydroxylase system protein, YqeB family
MVGKTRILIKGAGEMATGVAVRLYRAGFTSLLLLETDKPLAVRRAVSFCEAIYDGKQEVEGIPAERLESRGELEKIWSRRAVAVMADPGWSALSWFSPRVCVDAVIAKRNLGTHLEDAPLVVAMGPGFAAGQDAHCVVETNRGHNLGRIFRTGSAEANTGVPGAIGGFTTERVLRAPTDGVVEQCREIGESVQAGDVVCRVTGLDVPAAIAGVVRGCIRSGIQVRNGVKLGDIDPRNNRLYCFTVSEKARALGGSVLEAICADLFT